MNNRAIFLDRDGTLIETKVINDKPVAINDVNKLKILPGALESCNMLKSLGFLLVLITNQPDVSKGIVSKNDVGEINKHLKSVLKLDAFFVCYHDTNEKCSCKKPKPGLIMNAKIQLGIDLSRSYLIGDRVSDIAAGAAAGCKNSFLIKKNYSGYISSISYLEVDSILEAAYIISNIENEEFTLL